MKRIGLLMPFYNYTIEYEMQKYLNLNNLCFHIFKIQYQTSPSVNSKRFYDELSNETVHILDRLKKFKVNHIYVLCASLMVLYENEFKCDNILNLLINYCKKYDLSKINIYSPYDQIVDNKIISILGKEKIHVNKIIKMYIKGSHEYFEYGFNELDNLIKKNTQANIKDVVLCTNIPTLHLIRKNKMDFISSNYLLFEELERIDKYE